MFQNIGIDNASYVFYFLKNWTIMLVLILILSFLWALFKAILVKKKQDFFCKTCSLFSNLVVFNLSIRFFLTEFLNMNFFSYIDIKSIK